MLQHKKIHKKTKDKQVDDPLIVEDDEEEASDRTIDNTTEAIRGKENDDKEASDIVGLMDDEVDNDVMPVHNISDIYKNPVFV